MNFERLRELVLERAIRGELVPQNCDEDCVKEGTSEDVPFDVPASWGWVQLADLSVKRKTVDPMTIDEPNVELWSIPTYDSGAAQEICPKDIGSSKKIVLEGDVLLSKIVPHIKRAWVVTESGRNLPKLASTEWLVYGSGRLIPEFLALQFRSPYFRKKMLENISGMGSLKRVNPSSLAKVFLPVPPLLEQVRIVAKLEEAFAEIDRAEKAYQELQTLSGVLRGQILQEAIQGKLVPQLDSEEEVQQIGDAPGDVPFAIPEKWKWVTLSELVPNIVDCPHSTPKYSSEETKYLAIDTNCITPVGVIKSWRYVTEEIYKQRVGRLEPQKDDIIYTREGSIGRAARLPDGAKVCMGQRVMLIRPGMHLEPAYLQWYLMSHCALSHLTAKQRGIGVKHINVSDVKKLPVPVPPVLEQRRIVEKVGELLKGIDALSAR